MKKLATLFAAFAVTFSVAAQRSEPEGAEQKITPGGRQLAEKNSYVSCRHRAEKISEESCRPHAEKNSDESCRPPAEKSSEESCRPLAEKSSEKKCRPHEQAVKLKQLEEAMKKWHEQVEEWHAQVEEWHTRRSELFQEDRPQPEECRTQLEEPFKLLAEERRPPDKQLQPDNAGKGFSKESGAPDDSIGRQQRHKQRQEQIHAHKIGYFTTQLELTAEEAQAFWPVYNEYWEKRNTLFDERSKLMRKVKHDKIDDKKALQIAQRLVENTQDDARLVREYHSKLEKVLSPQKLLKYYAAEDSFRLELINILRRRQKTN